MIKKRLIGLLAHAKKYIVFNVLCQWLALFCQIGVVYAVTNIIGYAYALYTGKAEMNSAPDSVLIAPMVLLFLVCMVFRHLLDRLAAKASFLASVDVKRVLRERIYDKLLKLSVSYREKVSTAEVVQLATEGVEQLETYFGKYLSQFFYSLLAPLTLFFLFCTIDVKVAVVLLICVPLIPLSIVVVQKTAKKLLSKYWDAYANLGDSFLENLQGLTTLKIYQADEQKARQMDEESEHFRKITMKVLTMQLNSTSVMDIMAYGAAAVGMILALLDFRAGRIGLQGTLTMILLAAEFFLPLRVLGSFFHIAMNGMAASDKVFALLDLEEPEAFPVTGISMASASVTGYKAGIYVSDVHFSYDAEKEALRGVDFLLPAGSLTALVGKSGCGKSTIANLLTGRNHGYTGDIRIDGKPLNRTSQEDLTKTITLVRSESVLFKGTVEDNLRMGKPNASEDELHAVLRKVQMEKFLNTLDGLKTPVAEGASNFSGGQRQRLSLARALLHDTPYYIFDEATSGIDFESEEKIMEVIRDLAKTKTVLLITHRLANVMEADAVYMMEDGRITESGTHALLVGKEGAYSQLYTTQRDLERYAGLGAASGMQRTAMDRMRAAGNTETEGAV